MVRSKTNSEGHHIHWTGKVIFNIQYPYDDIDRDVLEIERKDAARAQARGLKAWETWKKNHRSNRKKHKQNHGRRERLVFKEFMKRRIELIVMENGEMVKVAIFGRDGERLFGDRCIAVGDVVQYTGGIYLVTQIEKNEEVIVVLSKFVLGSDVVALQDSVVLYRGNKKTKNNYFTIRMLISNTDARQTAMTKACLGKRPGEFVTCGDVTYQIVSVAKQV